MKVKTLKIEIRGIPNIDDEVNLKKVIDKMIDDNLTYTERIISIESKFVDKEASKDAGEGE